MGFIKRIGRSRAVQETLGFLLARYLRLVQATTRFQMDPPDIYDRIGPQMPVIVAMWHGQHFMVPFARRPQDPAAALVSRSGDGEFNAIALRHLGVRAIRGSGARRRSQIRDKGGARALISMARALAGGEMVVMTADVPKVSRVCGPGIIALARMSGRPICPVAVVSSRRIDFNSWDHASIGLPFGRGAIVIGEPVSVPADAGDEQLEQARLAVQKGLDDVHARAYALVGSQDPGAAVPAARDQGAAGAVRKHGERRS
ncbi:lysophospholipid acyltransferase family protein [Camelimonas abortus]|uniref:Lysophospholipid acyltransferase family protein n=1 Tax=Camelimonas abortus TaxID=1017184 RepID=A0ABV7LE14_9HYPH